jgi:hypothetical protein
MRSGMGGTEDHPRQILGTPRSKTTTIYTPAERARSLEEVGKLYRDAS